MLSSRLPRIVLCAAILTILFPFGSAQAATATFSSPAPIAIPDSGAASPYPSTITVGGLSGTLTRVTVTLNNISHTWSQDIDVLLVGPGGQSTMLMSDAGYHSSIVNATLSFDDAATQMLPNTTQIVSGTYHPTDYDMADFFPTPAPARPYSASLSVFNGTNPNGTWQLYVNDDNRDDSGAISGGWDLTVTTEEAASADPGAAPIVAPPWNPGDGRLNPEQAAPLAIFCDADSIYAYIPDYLEFDFPLEQIRPAPTVPARTLLAEYPDGTRLYRLATGQYQLIVVVDGQEQVTTAGAITSVGAVTTTPEVPDENTLLTTGVTGARLYRLDTGEFQVNFLHGSEEYVFTWDACPATRAITRVYNSATHELLAEYARTF